jgi:NAD(P)-dependent dehydrogenase (short-subunit alcohol dehydrogenase family)
VGGVEGDQWRCRAHCRQCCAGARTVAHGVGTDEAKQTLLTQAGISRYGEPQDVAELMAFLVSPRARWMTGAQLRIYGGEVKSI